MKYTKIIWALVFLSLPIYAQQEQQSSYKIMQKQDHKVQMQLDSLQKTNVDLTLDSSGLDLATVLNQNQGAYIASTFNESSLEMGPKLNNSAFNLDMGFINIGNVEKTPLNFAAGELYLPFGRYSSSMISSPLTANMTQNKAKPFIWGYKYQEDTGLFVAAYIYRGDSSLGQSGVSGANGGYHFELDKISGELGTSYISSVEDATGMQNTGANPGRFGGFGSLAYGNEAGRKTPAVNVYGNMAYERFNFALEWVGVTQAFRPEDLSFNGRGAKPQALHTEIDMTFRTFNKAASIGVGYQWTKDSLALNLPQQRFLCVFNISLWKNTIGSIEYRHDIDYGSNQFANGTAPEGLVNTPTWGSGRGADTVSARIGVYL